ncbi:MAG: RNA-binding S4 domain-containing protein [Eubacteriales bacterium]
MRLDKYLKVSRIIKRRTVAAELCDAGKVKVNGSVAKPARNINVGDIVELRFGEKILKIKVKLLNESIKKEDAQEMYCVVD